MQIIITQSSQNAAYAKMRALGFGGNYGRIGFADFSVQKMQVLMTAKFTHRN